MRIDRFEVYHVAMPLIYPWRTAYGEDYDIHSVVVRAVSGEYDAWSESSPLRAPTYLTESAASVFHNVTEFFGPHVVGGEYDSADELNERMRVFKGNSFAKAAIEICWWTLQSAITGTPVHRLLGGETREVQAGADFGIQDSYDMLLGNIQQAVDGGFPRIKLKVAPEWDLEMLRTVRDAFPDTTFHIDCNSGYTLDDLPFFEAIDELGLAFIEQPLHYADVLDHAELARRIRDAGVPGRDDRERQGGRAGDQRGRVRVHQHQAGARGRAGEREGDPRRVPGRGHTGLDRRDAGERAGRGTVRGGRDAAELHVSGRPVPVVALLHGGPVGPADGADAAQDVRAVRGAAADAGPGTAGEGDGAVEVYSLGLAPPFLFRLQVTGPHHGCVGEHWPSTGSGRTYSHCTASY